jgi:hypothetical protein
VGKSEEQTLKELKKAFKIKIPTGAEITREATRAVLGDRFGDRAWIKKNFSRLVEEIQFAAYELYLEHEAPAASGAFKKIFGPSLSRQPTKDEVFEMLHENFWALDRFFLGLTQGRRPRAGKAFEHVIKVLFDALGYPYAPQPIINGQPDFLLPSIEHYHHHPTDCIVFTVKRSLRERWRQITTEGAHGFRMFLATIDKGVKSRDLDEIRKNRIILVVPESVKQEAYPNDRGVTTFERFFRQTLDPAMRRWEEDGVFDDDDE